jgi:hypothetical protein
VCVCVCVVIREISFAFVASSQARVHADPVTRAPCVCRRHGECVLDHLPNVCAQHAHWGIAYFSRFFNRECCARLRVQVRMRHLAKGDSGEWVPQDKPVFCPDDMVPWASEWPSNKPHVFFGHDAVRGLQVHPNATGLDGGCLYGRRLIALELPSRQIFWVDAKRPYVVGSAAPAVATSTNSSRGGGVIGGITGGRWFWPVAVAVTAAVIGAWVATRRLEVHTIEEHPWWRVWQASHAEG